MHESEHEVLDPPAAGRTDLGTPSDPPPVPSGGGDRLQIDAEVDIRVMYAMAYNRRAPIKSVTVRNLAGGLEGPLTVTLGSSWGAAGRPPLKPYTFQLRCPDVGGAVSMGTMDSRLDDAALALLDEPAPAVLTVTVEDATGYRQTAEFEIDILARNQWNWDLYELTAAFIQPGHPAMRDILLDAARIAEGMGVGLVGYQTKPEGVDIQAKAIFQALAKRIDNYLMSPPSFDEEGQRVRPLDEVLEMRQGNCIELACAYASALLAANIDATIFFVHGHAFAGYFTQEANQGNRWPDPMTDEFASIMAAREQPGLLRAVETTMIPTDSFEDAVGDTGRHFAERELKRCGFCGNLSEQGAPPNVLPHLRAALNVIEARRAGVRALPARSMTDEGLVIVIDQGPAAAPVIERRDPVTHKLLPKSVPARVQQWKSALLDLSRRNPLINFKPASSGLQLVPPSNSLGEIEDAMADGREVVLYGPEQISQVLQAAGVKAIQQLGEKDFVESWRTSRALFAFNDRRSVLQQARLLNSRAVTMEQDTGVNNLYIALGSITWPYIGSQGKLATSTTSPVFLVPVRMTLKRGAKVPSLHIDPNAMTVPNYCLLEALRSRFQMKLEWFAEDMRDESGLDIEEGLTRLRAEVLELGLTEKGVMVEDTAALGMFAFDRVRLWKDMDEHWELFVENPVVRHLVDGGVGAFVDPADPDGTGTPEFDDATLLNPQPADGAQTRAIVRALAGQSFVLEGPPGTGKSQTITNLLANALAAGQKVLFVAEKAAALAVVRERLQAVGLDPFCLDLHDGGSKPETIKEQLREALEHTPDAPMDRWEHCQQAFTVAAAALDLYRSRVHHPTKAGRSYFDAYRSLLAMGDEPSARIGRALIDVDAAEIERITQLLLELPSFTNAAVPKPGHEWMFTGTRSFESVDRAALADAIGQVAGAIDALPSTGAWATALQSARTMDEVRAFQALIHLDASGGLPQMSQWRNIARADWQQAAANALAQVGSALQAGCSIDPGITPEILGRDLAGQLAAVREATSGFFMGRKGKVRTALGDLATLPAFAEQSPADVLSRFEALAAASTSYRAGIAALADLDGVAARGLSGPIDEAGLRDLELRCRRLALAAWALTTERAFASQAQAALNGMQAPPSPEAIDRLISGLDGVFAATSVADLDTWIAERTLVEAVRASLPTWSAGCDGLAFVTLKRWIDLLNHVAPLEDQPFTDFRTQILTGAIRGDEADEAFERALLRATLTVVGEEHEFDVFDQANQDRLVARFVGLLREREELLRLVIPKMLYDRRDFDASANVGAVGQLRMELGTKRRGARSVRDLLTRYPELIVELTPCFLMSSDSVAKFLVPGKIMFDLVVFDEASQIAVEEAVGAMGRGTAVVVVGDSKQMPPTKTFSAGGGSDEDAEFAPTDLDVVPEDEESILEECVESGLPREMLDWHYRSRDEVLISFSNEAYYGGRLASFPSPVISQPDCGFVYHRVDGQFHHASSGVKDATFQTNPIEADAIVAEIRRRAHDPHLSQFSMGVVTLNQKQRDLIVEKLEALQDPVILDLLDHDDPERRLMVLNLENVQGRERDVIILGTSFSKRADGSPMPLRFGPLVNQRGERRLNVAVTRARRQVVVFSSFDPAELAAAKSKGLIDLRTYLELARGAASDRDALDQAASATVDPYIEEVAPRLRDAGLVVRTGYGLSTFKVDIAVSLPGHEGRWLVGVLLDGVDWGRRRLALDRDALPVTVLQNLMNWPAIARVWLPAWRRDADEVVADIRELAHRVASGEVLPVPSAQPVDVDPVAADAVVDSSIEESVEESVDPTPEPVDPTPEPTQVDTPPAAPAGDATSVPSVHLDDLDTDDARIWQHKVETARSMRQGSGRAKKLRQWEVDGGIGASADEMELFGDLNRLYIGQVADIEGPIAVEPALKRVANAWGLARVRAARLAALEAVLPTDQLVRTELGDFLFPADCVDRRGGVLPSFDWYRQSVFADRRLDEIAPHEVANVCVDLVAKGHSMQVGELQTEILNFFGYGRKTAETLALAGRYIDWAVGQGYLERSGDTVKALRR